MRGFSLIEVVITSAVIGILALGVTAVMSNLNTQQRRLNEQLARTEVTNLVVQAVNKSQSCLSTMTTPTQLSFDSTTLPAAGAIPSGSILIAPGSPVLTVGTKASPLSNSLFVNGIDLVNIANAGGPDQWTGEIQVTFDTTKLVIPLPPVRVRIVFQTDPATPANAKLITSCTLDTALTKSTLSVSPYNNGSNSVTCPMGFFLSQCHVEVNSADWKSHFHNNRVVYTQDADGNLVGCNATMYDSDDQYRLVAVCIR